MDTKPVVKPESNHELALYTQATNIAGLCKEIVVATAVEIQGRKFVPVEAWTTIAVAHGCIATIKSVEITPDGVKSVAEVRRQSDGAVLSSAEGFVGKDEPVWFGGQVTRWNKFKKQEETVTMPKRADYAIRAMAQTRAVSRVCRTCFSHVVVMMKANLETVPAEEMVTQADDQTVELESANPPPAGSTKENKVATPASDEVAKLRAQFEGGKWKTVVIHLPFKDYKGAKLGDLEEKSLAWFCNDWTPKQFGNKPIPQDDHVLRAALDVAKVEAFSK